MNNSAVHNRQQDSLDEASQQYIRNKSSYIPQNTIETDSRPDMLLKNLYRQQLDEIMKQKTEQRKVQKERESQERQVYNQRIAYGRQAERMKDLSYKNYYQTLLNNQNNIAKQYVGLNYQRDNLKDQLIEHGIKEDQVRSQQWWEAEQRRIDGMKKNYREDLAGQVNQKNFRDANNHQSRIKQQQEFNKVTYTPQQIARFQRQRKLMEMSKYKQDLDKTNSPPTADKFRAMNGAHIVSNGSYTTGNDFNINHQNRHDPMTNPMPYNIQNPYILREFKRKQQQLQVKQNDYQPPYNPQSQPRSNLIS